MKKLALAVALLASMAAQAESAVLRLQSVVYSPYSYFVRGALNYPTVLFAWNLPLVVPAGGRTYSVTLFKDCTETWPAGQNILEEVYYDGVQTKAPDRFPEIFPPAGSKGPLPHWNVVKLECTHPGNWSPVYSPTSPKGYVLWLPAGLHYFHVGLRDEGPGQAAAWTENQIAIGFYRWDSK